MTRSVLVRLKIPDNEAYTALATLRRLGVPVASVERADLYTFECDGEVAAGLAEAVRTAETLFNPNKHELEPLEREEPLPGEAWVGEPDVALQLLGNSWAGVRSMRRRTAWRLFGKSGEPAAEGVVREALEKLLCNPAFQEATI